MIDSEDRRQSLARGVWLLAVVSVAIHLLPQPGYGFHRDEFLYLAMGDHLHLFRMSFPPMIAILAELARALPLPLLVAVRLLPALAGAALLVVTAMIIRELGGNRRAQLLGGLVMLFAPHFLRAGSLFQPVIFEHLWWGVVLLALAALLGGRDRRWWLVAGAAVGACALTKFSVAFLGVGLVAAVIFSPLRHDLRTRWPWLALGLAALLALPSLLGQLAWDWPFFAQAAALKANQLGHFDRKGFLIGQFLMEADAVPTWLLGLLALFIAPSLRRFRGLGLLALTTLAVLLVVGGKPYYFGPVHAGADRRGGHGGGRLARPSASALGAGDHRGDDRGGRHRPGADRGADPAARADGSLRRPPRRG